MKRTTLFNVLRFFFDRLMDYHFSGLENIPASGGVVVTTNHMSRLDTPLLLMNPKRDDITALVADKYYKRPFFRWFVDSIEGIWIDRSKADFAAFGEAIKVLRKGTAIGIAPEGTRSQTAELIEGKSGALLLSMRSGVPILPVAVWGTENAMKTLFSFKKPKLYARFGPAYSLPQFDRDTRDEQMKYWTNEMMYRIAALLPDQYHGFYKGHARIQEIRQEQGINPANF